MKRFLFLLLSVHLCAVEHPYYYSIEKLPHDIKEQMKQSGSWKKGCPVPLNDLRYLTMTYFSTDEIGIEGEMVVHKEVAQEVVAIFEALYNSKFTIERMHLIDDYNASDERSMAANNTSAFNCRNVPRTTRWSRHSYGKAIDINPVWNPFIDKGVVYPQSAQKYCNRELNASGIIKKNDAVYKAFIKRNWEWGGDWTKSMIDYQHFFKH
ncbi:M15 family metallopeptidase [bacterium]|nr:M15 family metallopeptidase [bacterium]MBU1957717.1 M15 family metallopeptidase [bacterium]